MKIKSFTIALLAVLVCTAFCGNVFAEEKRLEASLERTTVSVGNPVYLYITFIGAQDVTEPEIIQINGLKINYVGASTKISIINGARTQSVTHTYLVIARSGGRFDIGPFAALYGGKRYNAPAVTLIASGTPASSGASRTQNTSSRTTKSYQQTVNENQNLFVTMEIPKRQVYVNEMLPISILLYVGQVKVKNVQYPTYRHEGFSGGEFGNPRRMRRTMNGRNYEVLSFKQDLYAIKEGNYQLGPARINCQLMAKRGGTNRSARFSIDDFFGGNFGYVTYPAEAISESVPIKILPFPEKGRPSDFQGAVGNFNMTVYVKPTTVKVGDPIVITMTVTGDGNLDTVTSPVIDFTDDFKTYEPEVQRDNNRKIYEQILIPKTHNITEIPKVSFSFLDPRTGRYKTVSKGPFPMSVMERPDSEKGVKMVSMPGGIGVNVYPKEELGKDILHIKEDIGQVKKKNGELYRNKIFLYVQILPLLLLAAFYKGYKRKERMLTDKRYARFMKAPKKARKGLEKARVYLEKGDTLLFYDAVFKAMQGYLANKLNIAIGNISARSVEEKLHGSGYDEDLIKMIHEVFESCEMARYASSTTGGEESQKVFDMVKRVIDRIERAKL
ncbi:MAG: BatD family protein [Candidatus Aadella gelida]|nr:BatD family protein [Candidatus Aadella gelida]